MQTVYNIGTKGKFYGEVGGHMSQSTILDTQKCEHETASILNNFTIAFGKVHWGLPNFENLDELFENQQFVLMENEKKNELLKKVDFDFFENYDDTHTVMRFVTSWATREEDIDRLIEIL